MTRFVIPRMVSSQRFGSGIDEGRRAALAALIAAAFAPRASAQSSRVRCIGYLSRGARPGELTKPLAELGWIEGKNLRFEVRAVANQDSRALAAAAAELVQASVDVLFAYFTDRVEALARATTTIPIVCGVTSDPVGQGFATTLARPSRNITGLSAGFAETAELRIGLLKIMRPGLKRIAFVHGVADARSGDQWSSVARPFAASAMAAGISFAMAPVSTLADVERAFKALGDPAGAAALTVLTSGLPGEAADVPALAIRYRIAITGSPQDGALMYFNLEHSDPNSRIAVIIDKILRGVKPAAIPFELPDRTEFVVNRATAKAIGIDLPPEILIRATDVIGS